MDFLSWIVGLAVALASAGLCFFLAERNGMNRLGWPLLGFFFPLIGLVATVVVAMSKQKV